MKSLILCEHNNKTLNPSTLATITAATNCAQESVALVIGFNCHEVAKEVSQVCGISKVLHIDAKQYEYFLAENIALALKEIAQGYDYLLASATTFGKNILPRAAALLDVGQISDIVEVKSPDTFVRPVYAGNAMLSVKSLDNLKVISVRTTAFDKAPPKEDCSPIESIEFVVEKELSYFESLLKSESSRPDLGNASVIVSGGRGLQSAEKFVLVEELADSLGAAVGASRAAVDAGFVANDLQVGQTGKVVAPEIYIALGISGAIQHIAGMKDSKLIFAINKDEEAPIFQVASYGLVADVFDVVPKIVAALKS